MPRVKPNTIKVHLSPTPIKSLEKLMEENENLRKDLESFGKVSENIRSENQKLKEENQSLLEQLDEYRYMNPIKMFTPVVHRET